MRGGANKFKEFKEFKEGDYVWFKTLTDGESRIRGATVEKKHRDKHYLVICNGTEYVLNGGEMTPMPQIHQGKLYVINETKMILMPQNRHVKFTDNEGDQIELVFDYVQNKLTKKVTKTGTNETNTKDITRIATTMVNDSGEYDVRDQDGFGGVVNDTEQLILLEKHLDVFVIICGWNRVNNGKGMQLSVWSKQTPIDSVNTRHLRKKMYDEGWTGKDDDTLDQSVSKVILGLVREGTITRYRG